MWDLPCHHTHLLAGEEILNQERVFSHTSYMAVLQGLAQPSLLVEDRETKKSFFPSESGCILA